MVADTATNVLFVLDTGKSRVVRYNLTTGAYLGTITANFRNPQGIAFQPAVAGAPDTARLLVVDTGNNRLVLMSATGAVRDTLNYGINGATAAVWSPLAQRFYVLNAGAREIRAFQSTQNNGNNQLKFISSFTGSTASDSVLSTNASGINVQTDGTIVVADTGNNRVLRFSATGAFISKFGAYSATPVAVDGTLSGPRGVGSRSDGYLPVVDTGNHRVQVFESSSGGQVVAELGTAGIPGTGTNELNSPTTALTIGTNIGILADTGNSRIIYYAIERAPDAPTRTPIDYDGLNCTDCHSADIRAEHAARARGCKSCHRTSAATGKPDYSSMATRIADDLIAQGIEEPGSCGSNTRYCHSPEAKNPTTGVSRAIHGMDGYQVQQAHLPVDPDGTNPTTNACTGTAGGCHSENSTESPFWFGAHDPASAKSDYFFHQARGTASPVTSPGLANEVGTVALTDLDHLCMACHDQPSGRSFGEHEKAAAIANGESWTCTTTGCHDDTGDSGVYYSTAQMACYRTPNWRAVAIDPSGEGLTSDEASMPAGTAESGVSAFYQPLIDLVFGGASDSSSDVSILADPLELPVSATPASRPLPLEYLLMPSSL